MKLLIVLSFCAVVCLNGCTTDNKKSSENRKLEVRGWNILSDDIDKGLYAIESAEKYQINHLQLSHQLIMDLKDVRNPKKLETTRGLTKVLIRNNLPFWLFLFSFLFVKILNRS
jgi:hypothetical protein